MKPFIFGILIFGIQPVLTAQVFSLGLNVGTEADYFSDVNGQLDHARAGTRGCWSSDIEATYQYKSNFSLNCDLGVQVEKVGFVEIIPGLGSPIYTKEYRTPVLALGVGYQIPLCKSRFSIITSAGIGLGYMRPRVISDYYAIDNVYTWQEPQTGNAGTDTIHIVFDLRDLTKPGVNTQARGTLGLQYRSGHFFLKAFAETRIWLQQMAEVEYHIERIDTYYKWEMNYVANGHFTVRGGYLGIGIGAGWIFD